MLQSRGGRSLYLQPLRVSSEAIVLRNYPIGKGFLVTLPPADDRYFERDEHEGRPPFMFVKCWAMRYEKHTGVVRVKYDVRDTGFKVDPERVCFHPHEANKALLVWEAKRAMGVLDVGTAITAQANTLVFASKLGRHVDPRKLGAAAVAEPEAAAELSLIHI